MAKPFSTPKTATAKSLTVVVAEGYPLPAERRSSRRLLLLQRPLRRPGPVQSLPPGRSCTTILPVTVAAAAVAPPAPPASDTGPATSAGPTGPSRSRPGTPSPPRPPAPTPLLPARIALVVGLTSTRPPSPPPPSASVLGALAAAAPACGAVGSGPAGLGGRSTAGLRGVAALTGRRCVGLPSLGRRASGRVTDVLVVVVSAGGAMCDGTGTSYPGGGGS